jgi:twitching motility two-component system response regulator PilH
MTTTQGLILCIDDDPDVLLTLNAMLSDTGYSVATAGTAEEGLAAYKAQQPDLVLVDLMMEEVDSGMQFLRDIRALGHPAPPVIMLSSVGDELSREAAAEEHGLAGVLQKPVNKDQLLMFLKAKIKKD